VQLPLVLQRRVRAVLEEALRTAIAGCDHRPHGRHP
jgi:hypothetical protein